MADPVTLSAAISGVVALMAAYMKYRVDLEQARKPEKPAGDKAAPPQAETGKQAYEIVKARVEAQGNADERHDLAGFERSPERYREIMIRVLTEMADRNPALADELLKLARQQAAAPAPQGTATVSGQATVYGQVIGVATGDVTGGTYTIGPDATAESDQGADR